MVYLVIHKSSMRSHPWCRGVYISLTQLPCHVKKDKAVAPPTDFRKQPSPSLHTHSRRDDRLRMPKLDKMSPEEQVSISKKMFYGGLAFLPLLWLVNFIYFFRTIRQPSAPREMRKCMYGMDLDRHFKSVLTPRLWNRCVYVAGWVYGMVHYLDHVVCTLCWKADAMGCWSRSYHRRYTQRQLAMSIEWIIPIYPYHHHQYQYCINDDDSLAAAAAAAHDRHPFLDILFPATMTSHAKKLNEGCARSGWASLPSTTERNWHNDTIRIFMHIRKERGNGEKKGERERNYTWQRKKIGQHCVTFTYCCWAQDMWICIFEWGMRINNIGKEVSKWNALLMWRRITLCACVCAGGKWGSLPIFTQIWLRIGLCVDLSRSPSSTTFSCHPPPKK